MMTISIEDAATQLKRIIDDAAPGEEIVLTENDHPIARLIPVQRRRKQRVLGTAKGEILFMAEDFDAPLEDFREYME